VKSVEFVETAAPRLFKGLPFAAADICVSFLPQYTAGFPPRQDVSRNFSLFSKNLLTFYRF